jgi:pimeloyl-ACP methyl ester carboxylesterase
MEPQTLFVECPALDGKTAHKLAVYAWGREAAPRTLICAHGLTRTGRDFDFLAAALEGEYRIYAPDMPGRGQSQWLADPAQYGYPTYVADMLCLMDKLGLKQVDWVGTSMGGLIGIFIAASQPQRLRRMVINDIGPQIPKEALARLALYVGERKTFKDAAEAMVYARVIYAPWGIREEAHLQHLVAHSLRQTPQGLAFHYDPAIGAAFKNPDGSPKTFEDMMLWEVWEKVLCPVLLLRGGQSDLLPAEVAAKMWQQHPDMDYEEYPGVGHAPALMDTRQIQRIADFLRQD